MRGFPMLSSRQNPFKAGDRVSTYRGEGTVDAIRSYCLVVDGRFYSFNDVKPVITYEAEKLETRILAESFGGK